eukprot:3833352-Pleurochrysis_carterae.AAC.1
MVLSSAAEATWRIGLHRSSNRSGGRQGADDACPRRRFWERGSSRGGRLSERPYGRALLSPRR